MKTRTLLLAAALALVAVSCGDSGTTTTPPATSPPTTQNVPTTEAATTTTAAPVTTTTAAPTTTTTAAPERTFTGADGVESTIGDTSRIVSLAGDITEILFELGRGDSVVAIDVTTTYPPEAAQQAQVIGFAQQLAPEPVIAFQPTLVIGDEFTAPPEAIDQIRATGVPVVILPTQTTLEGVSVKIRQIAEIVGAEAEGEALVDRVEAEIQEAVDLAAQATTSPRVAYLYTRGPQTLLLFGAGMPTQAMINGANAIDAGAETGVRGAVPLTPEALVAAGPDVIVLPSAGLQALGGMDALTGIPGVAETPAGQSGTFLDYDEAFFFNLGPRAGQALKAFVLDLYPELAGDS